MPAEVLTNLESIGEMVGALAGLSAGMDDKAYIEGLIKAAHGKAATAFDAAAAATAQTGMFPHVYEYGTLGINRGQSRFSDPMSLEARLYYHTLTGHGGAQSIGYSFRPARQPNPKPTPESTGVDSKYLSKLSNRKYYFYNKAYVMETGQPVSITAKNGNFLFVPFYGQPSNDPLNRRGYMMWDSKRLGPLFNKPGRSTKGQFTKFWMTWWGSAGSKLMYGEMEKYVRMDLDIAEKEAAARAKAAKMKPVQATNMPSAMASAKAWFSKIFGTSTAKRMETKTK